MRQKKKDPKVKQQEYYFQQSSANESRPQLSETSQRSVRSRIGKNGKIKKIGNYHYGRKKDQIISFKKMKQSKANSQGQVKVQQKSVCSEKGNDIKLEETDKIQKYSENGSVQVKRQARSKNSDPDQDDLCEALKFIKKKLPHRSLDKIILKLYQRIEQEQKTIDVLQQSRVANFTDKNCSEQPFSRNGHQQMIPQKSHHDQSFANTQTVTSEASKYKKVVLPGRRKSVYHDSAGDIAALTHDAYKQNPPTLQEIQALEKNLEEVPVVAKPLPSNFIPQQFKEEKSKIRQTIKQEVYYRFDEAQTKRTKFHSDDDEERYERRRELAQIFIEHSCAMSKQLDQRLVSVGIGRVSFRSKMGGILINVYRKFQSFLTSYLKLTIRYLMQDEMRRISLMLINARILLQPNSFETFVKFMKINYGLGDVVVSRSEAIQLYVGCMRYLKGQDITLSKLENMGRIYNQRNLKEKVTHLKKYAQYGWGNLSQIKYKPPRAPELTEKTMNGISLQNNYDIWFPQLDHKLISLYISGKDLPEIKLELQNIFQDEFNAQEQHQIERRIFFLADQAMKKVVQNSTKQTFQPPLRQMSEFQTDLLLTSPEGNEVKKKILRYSLSENPLELPDCITAINSFLETNFTKNGKKDLNFFEEKGLENVDENLYGSFEDNDNNDIYN